MRVRIFTFGCKVNQYESQWMREAFAGRGDEVTDSEEFDIAVVNTCCVTAKAEKDARLLVRKLARAGKVVRVTGCLPEKPGGFPFQDFPDADLLPRKNLRSEFPFVKRTINGFFGHTRAFVKVEDGCNAHCSYCIVPLVRGPVKTRRESDILEEARQLAAAGYRELVLTGVNLGCYGLETGTSLSRLVVKLAENSGIARIRFS